MKYSDVEDIIKYLEICRDVLTDSSMNTVKKLQPLFFRMREEKASISKKYVTSEDEMQGCFDLCYARLNVKEGTTMMLPGYSDFGCFNEYTSPNGFALIPEEQKQDVIKLVKEVEQIWMLNAKEYYNINRLIDLIKGKEVGL